MKSKRHTLYNALPIVAAAYGEKFGVKVTLGGDQAYTNGKSINIPNVPESFGNRDAIWGYLAHEAAHVRFTDFSVSRAPGLHAMLTNIIEDCRIEQAMIALYPGTAHTLHETARYMVQAGHYQPVTDRDSPASMVAGYCLYWLQSEGVGQAVLRPFMQTASAILNRVLPSGVCIRLEAILLKAVDTQSTQQAADFATAIIQMIEEEKDKAAQNPPPPPQKGPQDHSQGQDQGRADDQTGSGSNDSPSTDNGQANADAGGPKNDASSGQSGSHSSDSAQPGQDDADSSGPATACPASQDDHSGTAQADLPALLQQILTATGNDLPRDAHAALLGELQGLAHQAGDPCYQTVKQARSAGNDPQAGNRLLQTVRSHSSRLRQQLLGLVQASQQKAVRAERRGKKVDHRRLTKVLTGDSRVFSRSADKVSPNTAVHVLVDMSSSMNKGVSNGKKRADIARESALSLALALEGISGVNPAVTFFAGDSHAPVFSAMKHGERVQSSIGGFVFSATGTTPMAEALWHSAFELSKTREQRKLLIVITDGEPDNAVSCTKVIDLCERSDVEVIGIGIETSAVTRLFSRNVVIQDAADLQKALFRLMERALTAPVV
ncbi:VWA domain-containing protein [Azomonas macrocytogenes]|uniref:Nitric oxide reductase activation protein n=1 Tax=Azomonas macrocytogenes TaxID=69962 RepID=A0A839T6P2_AZOMA|nr:VWA domain-containing protein [Azomonas macrocytogenes]MBB3105151.1 nitric oxide reductase activation protein [Azomonas macrocytogenes]